MTNKTLKLVSFILACVMLAVAIATIVCLYVGDGPIVQPAPDDGNGGAEQATAIPIARRPLMHLGLRLQQQCC